MLPREVELVSEWAGESGMKCKEPWLDTVQYKEIKVSYLADVVCYFVAFSK